jgi:RNA polymerase sigma-70 factor (ECF subfamily)
MGALERLLVPGPDEAAALYRQHGEAVRAFVGGRVRDPGAAEDICQETFLAAIARGVPPGSPEDAARWIFAIARNKVLRWHRDDRGARARGAPAEGEGKDPASSVPVRLDPERPLEDREERARVRAAVGALEPELREVILLRYEGGLDYRAVAERLAVPVSTIQGRLKRARIALRAALLDEGSEA